MAAVIKCISKCPYGIGDQVDHGPQLLISVTEARTALLKVIRDVVAMYSHGLAQTRKDVADVALHWLVTNGL